MRVDDRGGVRHTRIPPALVAYLIFLRYGMKNLMFGDGEIDFPPILRTLEEIGYSGGVHVELSRHSHDAVETARKALAFLKSH